MADDDSNDGVHVVAAGGNIRDGGGGCPGLPVGLGPGSGRIGGNRIGYERQLDERSVQG